MLPLVYCFVKLSLGVKSKHLLNCYLLEFQSYPLSDIRCKLNRDASIQGVENVKENSRKHGHVTALKV